MIKSNVPFISVQKIYRLLLVITQQNFSFVIDINSRTLIRISGRFCHEYELKIQNYGGEI